MITTYHIFSLDEKASFPDQIWVKPHPYWIMNTTDIIAQSDQCKLRTINPAVNMTDYYEHWKSVFIMGR